MIKKMISMVSKQEIILRYSRGGHSQRRISKDLGLSRPTVKKYIEEYERGKKLMKGGVSEVEGLLLEELFGQPKYKLSKRNKRKLTTEIGELISGYLDQNRSKRSRGLHKQVMKKIDIWEALKEGGHEIGYTTVCNYWNNTLVCRHERRMGAHGWYIELEHYLDTLRNKPGALAGSLALKTAEQHLRSLYETHFTDQPKIFIELLHYQRDKQVSILTIEQAVAKSLELCPNHSLNLDKIKVLCEHSATTQSPLDQPVHGAIEQASQAQLQALAKLLNPIN